MLSTAEGSVYGVLAQYMSPVTSVSTPAPKGGSSVGGGSLRERLTSSDTFRRHSNEIP